MDKLDDILLAISRSEEIDKGIIVTASQQIVDSVMDGLSVTRSSIWLIDSSIKEMSCFISRPNFPHEANTSHNTDTQEYKSFLNALEEQHYLISYDNSDFMQSVIFNDDGMNHDTPHSSISCAIRYRGELIGILRCEVNEHKEWTFKEGNFLTNLAGMVGRGLLAQRWQSAKDSLETANNRLEEKVKLRTIELSETLEELYQLQDRLVESEKMAALGGLVAGVAHEINTPLGICITSVSYLITRSKQLADVFKSGEITEENLTKFLKSSDETLELTQHHLQRTANLVKSFKQVAVDQSIDEVSTFNLHDKLEELTISFRHELKTVSASMFIECPQDFTITSYPGVIDQVITNLTMNSIYHGLEDHKNGIITIEVKKTTDYEFILTFSDNGCGIPVENRKKIFDPFFTTRRHKGGTGLGLNILYNLVNHKMMGEVKLADGRSGGTAFIITLPIHLKVVSEPA